MASKLFLGAHWHHEPGVRLATNVDDLLRSGPSANLNKERDMLSESYEVRGRTM